MTTNAYPTALFPSIDRCLTGPRYGAAPTIDLPPNSQFASRSFDDRNVQAGYAALVPEIFESAPHAAMTTASIGGEDLISAIDNSVLRREVKHACRTLARHNAVNAGCNGIRPRLVRPSGFVVDALNGYGFGGKWPAC